MGLGIESRMLELSLYFSGPVEQTQVTPQLPAGLSPEAHCNWSLAFSLLLNKDSN